MNRHETLRIRRYNASVRPALRLFCFPYAGGGISVFQSWPEALPAAVEVCSPELPGRDTLIGQPAFTRVPPLVRRLVPAVEALLDIPFVFFGHSMGALLAFELTRELRRLGAPLPELLLVSGHRAPHLPDPRARLHGLPDPEFLAELRRLEGTPAPALANGELMQLFLPLLRADFELSEKYEYTSESPLDVPIAAWAGSEDAEVSVAEVAAWREHTSGAFRFEELPGTHFFIHGSAAVLQHGVRMELTRVLARLPIVVDKERGDLVSARPPRHP